MATATAPKAVPVSVPVPSVTQPAIKERKKRTANAPVDETKAQKFRRLAIRRVPRAIKALNAIGNLGNMAQYEYLPEQWEKIKTVIHKAVADMESAFVGRQKVADMFTI